MHGHTPCLTFLTLSAIFYSLSLMIHITGGDVCGKTGYLPIVSQMSFFLLVHMMDQLQSFYSLSGARFVSGPHFYCWFFFFFFGNTHTHIYICMLTCLCFFSLSWRHEAALARLFCNSFQMCLCSPLVKSGNPTQGLCQANTR